MRLPSLVHIGSVGLFVLSAAGCSGASPTQGQGGLPAAIGGANHSAAAVPLAGAPHSGGVGRSIAGCSGSGTGSFIGGINSNVAAGIDSGVLSGFLNEACNNYSGITVGYDNLINASSGSYQLIGAGYQNAINSGGEAFIGAGIENVINSPGTDAVIGGGNRNTASGQFASIIGGSQNIASGTESTVPGGGYNTASGYASFAAGYHANANQGGSFVWSDTSSSSSTKPTAANQFIVRAAGGVTIYSNAAMMSGVTLPSGSTAWQGILFSDRAMKMHFAPVSESAILDKIAAMPITQWSYIAERGIRHVGPMAQDFRAAFGLGENDRQIMSVDEGGIALAAIKALHAQLAHTNARLLVTNANLAQKDAAFGRLRRQMNDLRSQVRQEFAQLKREVIALRSRS